MNTLRRPADRREFQPPLTRGRARLCLVYPDRRLVYPHPYQDNLVLYSWATIAANLLALGNAAYKIAAMYIEFDNSGAPVAAPVYDRTGGISYYQGLSTSAVRDYLRVPIIAATVTSDNPTLYPGGNLMTFFAQTAGTAGVQGKTFSDVANSRVIGAALVATPNFADATQDQVYSRIYFSTSNQQAKLPTSQVGVDWPISLQ